MLVKLLLEVSAKRGEGFFQSKIVLLCYEKGKTEKLTETWISVSRDWCQGLASADKKLAKQ